MLRHRQFSLSDRLEKHWSTGLKEQVSVFIIVSVLIFHIVKRFAIGVGCTSPKIVDSINEKVPIHFSAY